MYDIVSVFSIQIFDRLQAIHNEQNIYLRIF